ncbi:MAG: response regulator [Sporomusaceae bacterium]|jgi:two-component system response regulator (stage 0 sporulation protein F)|nr:response regulator [Sporomusaceae bacterium]
MTTHQQKILIVDDQPGIRRLLTEVLTAEGYDVLAAANGFDALNLAAENKPDVILMDMNMPGMNGMDALKEIERKGYQGRVIMMTAYGEIATVKEIMSTGTRSYITKPFDINLLLEMIQQALEGSEPEITERLLIG